MIVIKRDGAKVPFDATKISNAIQKAYNEVKEEWFPTIGQLAVDKVLSHFNEREELEVEEIQDEVETVLMSLNPIVARAYIRYRYKRELARKSNTTDKSIKELLDGDSDYWNNENSNKNAKRTTVQRDYMAGIVSTDITKRFLLDKDIVEAHDAGIIHFHDADYFAQNALHNCELINLDDMLQNGTVVNGVLIEKPKRLLTATTIATLIIAAVTSSSYGGATITLTHLAPFVRSSFLRYYKNGINLFYDTDIEIEATDCPIDNPVYTMSYPRAYEYAMMMTRKEVSDSVQTFNYQTNSMTNTNGQAPFLSVCMYMNETQEYKVELAMLIEEFLKQRTEGMKNEKGVYITPAFPKLLYILEEDNVSQGSKYWYLTELAAKCTAKRLVPDYISEKKMLEYKIDKNGNGQCYPCMGCRSFLTPYVDENGKPKYYGRFNQGVVTINLADIAFSSNRDMDAFWKIFDERLELCHRALQARHERLSHANADVSPILWRYGALARLPQGASIHELLHHGYSTISLGYAALYECVKYMTGESHTKGGKEFGLAVMQRLNDACKKWKEAEDIDYSVYGSPIESTTYKFAKSLKKRFGDDVFIKLDGKDRDYVTNSYHVPVFEEIDAFNKLSIESEFQKLSPGGAISYIETPNMQNNIEAVEQVIQFIYNHIMYAELNTKSDYCQECGYDGEILLDDDLNWYCPNCGNKNHETLNVARRTCGYIGSQFWNHGRTMEIRDRVMHL